MNNPVAQPKDIFPSVLLALVMMAATLLMLLFSFYVYKGNDPYIQSVLSIQGDRQRGHEIFEINCAACHGQEANGNVGPGLHDISRRRSKNGLIHQVTSGKTPPMPKFQPNTQEMADLLSYLENL